MGDSRSYIEEIHNELNKNAFWRGDSRSYNGEFLKELKINTNLWRPHS